MPCVLVMNQDVLIKRAFASLLDSGKVLDVVVSEAKDEWELTDDIDKTKPDVLCFSGSIPLVKMDSLPHLLMRHAGLKVIIVSEESNWLHMFKHEDRLVTSLQDLIQIIDAE